MVYAISSQGTINTFVRYTNQILIPDLINLLNQEKQRFYLSFERENGNLFLLYDPKNEKLVRTLVYQIEQEKPFLKRNIRLYENNQAMKTVISKNQINHFIDNTLPGKVYLHQSDFEYIKTCLDLNQHTNPKNYPSLKDISEVTTVPANFYLLHLKDKIILNKYIAADITSEFYSRIFIGQGNNLISSKHSIESIAKNVKHRHPELVLFFEHPFKHLV
ncbi:MAG: hypothetical protein PHE32_00990 [Candidatus Shapirobacteria bacterium]|nr:hypothetical protein [Candidatus Shapirobacteria bacterium]MDD4410268.1 hypothetical protein [Candidatus Shapirobacteria bacterium]